MVLAVTFSLREAAMEVLLWVVFGAAALYVLARLSIRAAIWWLRLGR